MILILDLNFLCFQINREDKASFAFGLLVIILGEYLVLRQPDLFVYFYTVTITALVIRRLVEIQISSPLNLLQVSQCHNIPRYFEYTSEKCQLFMLDLCYFVNISSLLQLNLAPKNVVWFQANYALAMGSLMNAMVVWQNTLVLHNISKLTSLLLHAFAPLTLHLVR